MYSELIILVTITLTVGADPDLQISPGNSTSSSPVSNLSLEDNTKSNEERISAQSTLKSYQVKVAQNYEKDLITSLYHKKRESFHNPKMADENENKIKERISDREAENMGGNGIDSKVNKYRTWSQSKLKKKATDYRMRNDNVGSPYIYRAFFFPRAWIGKDEKLSGRSVELDNATVTTIPTPNVSVFSYYLHPMDKPSMSFKINSDRFIYIFDLSTELKNKYFISVIVEKMNCDIEIEDRNSSSPRLSIHGDTGETQMCVDVDASKDKFQSVNYATDGDKQVTVRGYGKWGFITASIVVTIYHEAPHCSTCESQGYFCCGNSSCNRKFKQSILNNSEQYVFRHQTATVKVSPVHQSYRCISRSLLCNQYPNCGFSCNLDELKDSCLEPWENEGENCTFNGATGIYTCRYDGQDKFVLILLLVLFCVFLPFCIFIFVCGRKDLRRAFSRRRERTGCPLPMEILLCPFSINADTAVPPENVRPTIPVSRPSHLNGRRTTTARGDERRRGRRVESNSRSRPRPRTQLQSPTSPGIDNFSFFDDLPPSYSECCNDKTTYPTPSKIPLSEISLPGRARLERSHSDPLASANNQHGSIQFIVLPEDENHLPNSNVNTGRSHTGQMHWCTCTTGTNGRH